jgi:hypothetical protein
MRALAAFCFLALVTPSCRHDASPAAPAVTPEPVAAATDTDSPPPAKHPRCTLPKGPGDGVNCPRMPPGRFVAAVDGAIGRVILKHPEYFEDASAPLPRLADPTSYLHGVAAELRAAGYCSIFDGAEIAVKNANAFSEQYAVWNSTGYVRRGDGLYRATCTPAWF